MKKFQGISKKTMSNGEVHIFVRFKHLGKIYPVKNFTKLFGCKTETKAKDKLAEIKILISQGKNPFSNNKTVSLNDLFYERYNQMVKNKKWKERTTAKQYKEYYEKIIKNEIGHLKISKINYSHLDKIIKKLSHTQGMYRKRLKFLLNPIFEEQIKLGEIEKNPCSDLPKESIKKREKISNRVENEDFLFILKELYSTINVYNFYEHAKREEFRNFFMLMLLTTHRYGELTQLTINHLNIEKKYFITNEDITKSNEVYRFPIPDECIEYLSNIKTEKLFPNIKYGAIYGIFGRIVRDSNIQLFNGKTLTPHDIRRLFLNIMIRQGFDSRLVDFCLEHKQNDVIDHYLDLSYKSKVKVFKEYWSLIRT